MDNNHTLLQITQPEGFADIQRFLDANFTSLEDKVKAVPGYAGVSAALQQYLANCRFRQCTPSKYYLEALGLNAAAAGR
jgi:hypothetical protein